MVRILAAMAILIMMSCGFAPSINSRRPIVVINFDDGDSTIITTAFPLMCSLNVAWRATHFLPIARIGSPGGVTLTDLKVMEAAGWESGGHGIVHHNLSSLPLESAAVQIRISHDSLAALGLSHACFAYPTGNYSAAVESIAVSYFSTVRTSHDFEYLDGVNRHELGYFAVQSSHSAADLIARVERAQRIGSPLVILGFHVILPDTAAPVNVYYCRERVFREFLQYLAREEYDLPTLSQAMTLLQ